MAVAYAMPDEPRPTGCPAAGFVTYENTRVLLRNKFITFTKAHGIEDCYRECISRPQCGFFEISVAGFCIMFTPEFRKHKLILSFNFKVGVPCERTENPTEAFTATPTEALTESSTPTPTEAPTEASTAIPTEAPTEASTTTPTEAPTEASTESIAAPNDCPAEGYFIYPESFVSSASGGVIATFLNLRGQDVDVVHFCNAACSSDSDCGFFLVRTLNRCIKYRGSIDEATLSSDLYDFVGVPCCPAQGYVIYSGNAIRGPDLLLDIVELGQEEGGDNCNAECSVRRECGYFHVQDNNCVMFRGSFDQSLLLRDAAGFVGVPCEGIENPTENPNEASTEAPTEGSTATPTGVLTLAPVAPDGCPIEGYFRYPERSVTGPSLAFLRLNEQGVDANDICNAQCNSFSGCGYFEVSEGNLCIITRGTFDEPLLSSDSNVFVGVPCCPVQGYFIYSGNAIRGPDLLLDMVELGQEEGGDNCNSECSLRPQCGYFHVADNNCVMFRGPFRLGLLSSHTEAFVGVPCSS